MTGSLRLFGIALLALGLLLAAAASGQAQRKPDLWLDPDKSEPAGTHYRTFKSKLVGGEVSYLVYLPPDYDKDTAKRYPVLYWLHGMGGNQRGDDRKSQSRDSRTSHP